jgi:FkbM family methyltransferase
MLNNFKDKYLNWLKQRALKRWFSDGGDNELRYNYPLNSKSIVFDLGGYIGDWSYVIQKKYSPHLYIFEPITEYYNEIRTRFNLDENIKIYNYGLSDSNFSTRISLSQNGSSIYKESDKYQIAKFKDINSFVIENDIQFIDLIKINIEGGEYALLKRMIEKKLICICRYIQIQFHLFYKDSSNIRKEIRQSLRKTHSEVYNYPYVWENWQLINSKQCTE